MSHSLFNAWLYTAWKFNGKHVINYKLTKMGERTAVERPVEEVEWTEEGNLIQGEEVARPTLCETAVSRKEGSSVKCYCSNIAAWNH